MIKIAAQKECFKSLLLRDGVVRSVREIDRSIKKTQ
jgi:hypothetical protein